MKFALGVEYDGSKFFGWQRQRSVRTVQECVEDALSIVANERITVYCAGRTDTGVHASGQVIHFETSAQRSQRSWLLGTNSNLPDDIGVQWARAVDDEFHARFSAFSRTYLYLICNRAGRPGLWNRRVSFVHAPLRADLMHEAAQHLLGEHDFSAFRGAGCQANQPVRSVAQIGVERRGAMLGLTITANAFLLHMVRNIVGALLQVGREAQAPDWIEQLLCSRDRRLGGVTAPAAGLYLVEVGYPERFALPLGEQGLVQGWR